MVRFVRGRTLTLGKYRNRLTRKSCCKEYVGPPIYGYEELMLPIDVLRKNKHKELDLFSS